MRRAMILILVAACGGASKQPEPVKPPAEDPAATAPAPAAKVATCDDLPAAIDETMKEQEAQVAKLPPEQRTQASEMMAKMAGSLKEILVRRCKEDSWSQEATTCLASAKTEDDFYKCEGTLSPEQKDKVQNDVKAAFGQTAGGDTAVTAGQPPAEPVWPESNGIKECDAYLDHLKKYVACEKVPQEAKAAAVQSVTAMSEGWAALKDPKATKKQKKDAAKACKDGDKTVQKSAKELACQL